MLGDVAALTFLIVMTENLVSNGFRNAVVEFCDEAFFEALTQPLVGFHLALKEYTYTPASNIIMVIAVAQHGKIHRLVF